MTNKEEKIETNIIPKSKKELIAKKDHVIVQNDFKLVITKGKPIKDLPEEYIETLKTEQVI